MVQVNTDSPCQGTASGHLHLGKVGERKGGTGLGMIERD